jgi:DNA-binding SARP family transcriptional activator
LYRGELFADSPYDEWLLPRRRALRTAYVDLLERIAGHALATGDAAACAAACHKILAVEPCSEPAHQGLMRSYARQGHTYLALRQYQQCVDVLRVELDVDVSVETSLLRERIRSHQPV